MYNNAINSFGKSLGTVGYCKTCKTLLRLGVNSQEAAKELGVRGGLLGWVRFLKEHEAYHLNKGEALPLAFTADGLSDKMKARVVELEAEANAPRPVYHKPVVSDEAKAIMEFKLMARPEVKQRTVHYNNPVWGPAMLDTRPFGDLKPALSITEELVNKVVDTIFAAAAAIR